MNYTQFNFTIWTLRLVSSLILIQTLCFKFSASTVSVYIFSRLGIEPWGRISLGFVELVAALLILIPRTSSVGALMAACVMTGAIIAHLTMLALVVQNDGGAHFILAIAVFICSTLLVIIFKRQLKNFSRLKWSNPRR